jgi:hypothetical protein
MSFQIVGMFSLPHVIFFLDILSSPTNRTQERYVLHFGKTTAFNAFPHYQSVQLNPTASATAQVDASKSTT